MNALRKPAPQRVRTRTRDLDVDQVADQRIRAIEVDQPELTRTTRDTTVPIDRLHEHLFDPPDAGLVTLPLPLLLWAFTTCSRRRFSISGTSSFRRKAVVPGRGE